MRALESVLEKYVAHLIVHVQQTLTVASQIGKTSHRTYVRVASIIKEDISGNSWNV